jgi:hypothetical protein
LLLAACEASDKTTTDTQASTESTDGGSNPTATNGDDAGIMIPGLEEEADAGMPQACTLADAQEMLDGLWSRKDAMDVWTEEEVARCNAQCENQPSPNQCIQNDCPGGLEYIACIYGWRYYCASQPESGCSEEYRAFGCCVRANCASADDESCLTSTCYSYLEQMTACANAQCSLSARDMCVR